MFVPEEGGENEAPHWMDGRYDLDEAARPPTQDPTAAPVRVLAVHVREIAPPAGDPTLGGGG